MVGRQILDLSIGVRIPDPQLSFIRLYLLMLTDLEYDKIARSGCFVCRIVDGNPLIENPQIIYEDEKVIAFLSQLPTQKGYTIVSPKKHLERFEEMNEADWLYLQKIVQRIANAVSVSTGAIRMYIASLGSPERNSHLHIHVCPCPPGTPIEDQQFAAMEVKDGKYLDINLERMREIAANIKQNLKID